LIQDNLDEKRSWFTHPSLITH